MQFNNQSDNQDIVSSIGDATGIDTTNELKQITRAANRANRLIWSWIFEAYGGWQYDDSNNSDLPTLTANLVQDQSKYVLPAETLTIRGLEVKNESGDWRKLKPLAEERLRQAYSEEEFLEDSGEPQFYTPYAGLVKIHPAPDYAQASSIRLAIDRGSVSFSSTDISKAPGFVAQFHEAVAVGASYFIAVNKGLDNVNLLREEWGDMPEGVPDRGYKKAIEDFYSRRFVEKASPVISQGRNNLTREFI